MSRLIVKTVREVSASRWSAGELLDEAEWTIAKLDEWQQLEGRDLSIMSDGFGLAHEHGNSSISATTPPHGNPPATYEVAVASAAPGPDELSLHAIEVMLANAGSASAGTLTLEADDDGVPSGAAVWEWQVDLSQAGSQPSLVQFAPLTELPLMGNREYW